MSPHETEGRRDRNVRGSAIIGDMSEPTGKARALATLQALPDDATLDDAIERICFIAKVEEGLRQSEAGELTPHEDVKRQFPS